MNEEEKQQDYEARQTEQGEEYTIRGFTSTFYQKKMISIVLFVWLWSLIFIALAIFAAVALSRSDEVFDIVLYAMLFLTAVIGMFAMKIFAWQLIHREALSRKLDEMQQKLDQLVGQGKRL